MAKNLLRHISLKNKRHFWLLVTVIAALIFAVRVSQIHQGLPDVQLSDENSDLSTTAKILTGQVPPDIHFHRLAILWIEVPAFGLVYLKNALGTGQFSFSALQNLYFAYREYFVFSARLLIVIVSTIAIYALADLVRRCLSPTAAIIAIVLGGCYYFWNINLLYAMPDSLIPSVVVFYLWAVVLVYQRGSRLDYLLAGIALAFVLMCKISAATIGITLVLAHFFRVWNESKSTRIWQQLIVSDRVVVVVGAFVCGCIIANPLAFLHPQMSTYELHLLFNQGFDTSEAIGNTASNAGNFLHSAYSKSRELFEGYVGVPLLVALLLSVVFTIRRRSQFGVLMISAFLAAWLTIALSIRYEKASYWLPLVPMIVILAAYTLFEILKWSQTRGSLAYSLGILVVVVVISNEALLTLKVSLIVYNDYTFEQAETFIEQNWPKSSSVLMGANEVYSVPILRDTTSILRAQSLGHQPLRAETWWLQQAPQTRPYEYNIYGPEFQGKVTTYDALHQLILDNQIQYVITVDNCDGTTPRPSSTSAQEFPAIDRSIRSDLQLIKVFTPFNRGEQCLTDVWERIGPLHRDELYDWQRPGPIVKLYKVTVTF